MQTPRLTVGFFLAAALAPSQQDAVFSADVEVVNVLATVHDQDGALVTNLEKDDFVLKEDGEEQQIQYFARETDLPLTIGLLVDTSRSQVGVLDEQRRASYRFLDRVLQEKDQAFLISFDVDVELLQDLTSSKTRLELSLRRLQPPALPRMRRRFGANNQFPRTRRPGGQGGSGTRGVGTVLYDAVYLGASDRLKDQAGRKALIVISDGVDFGSKLSDREAIEAVHREDGIVYSIHFADDRRSDRRRKGDTPDGKKALRKLSEETGGRMYRISNDLTLDQVFDQIEAELRSQYSLGYTPEPGDPSQFRRIELEAKPGGLEVSTRSGYYPAAR